LTVAMFVITCCFCAGWPRFAVTESS